MKGASERRLRSELIVYDGSFRVPQRSADVYFVEVSGQLSKAVDWARVLRQEHGQNPLIIAVVTLVDSRLRERLEQEATLQAAGFVIWEVPPGALEKKTAAEKLLLLSSHLEKIRADSVGNRKDIHPTTRYKGSSDRLSSEEKLEILKRMNAVLDEDSSI